MKYFENALKATPYSFVGGMIGGSIAKLFIPLWSLENIVFVAVEITIINIFFNALLSYLAREKAG